ncbi:GLPGLI family protein [Flavobacterium sp. CG_9.1]|uniref:GLPGLI family protein n=1 Tax=Flavobacterium sp. CG_9.1 TaxID=2787728 RepID=UPI0018C9D3E0|nr:GLPGLI family protein [Flavobacterium sp. CG_9.1]MBG6060352.1 GLPGLI family protein [Flavobacterium sp. CG_9.1]
MKKLILYIVVNFVCIISYSQTAIKVFFDTNTVVKEESLKDLPVHIRAAALQQLNSIKKESAMIVQGNTVYFEIKPQQIDKKQKGTINSNDRTSGVLFSKDLSLEGSYPGLKILKNFKTKTIKTKIKGKLTTEKLVAVNWKITNKKKKILSYTCYEATTTFKNKLLTVYVTNDLKVSGSPSDLPFINGLVLLYKHGNSTTTAQRIELNQEEPLNFL